MSAASVAVDLVRALAWPTVVVSGLVITRGEVRALLRERLVKVEGLGFSAEFERASVEVEAATVLATASDEASNQPRRDGGLAAYTTRLVSLDPKGTILEAYDSLAQDLLARLEKAGVEVSPADSWNANRLAALAVSNNVIPAKSSESVQGLTIMRNLVAGNHGGTVDAAQAADFLGLVEGVRYTFRPPTSGY